MVPLSSERRTAGTAGDRGAHATATELSDAAIDGRTAGTAGDRGAHATATELSDAAIDGRTAGTAGDRGAHLASLSEGRRAGWPGS